MWNNALTVFSHRYESNRTIIELDLIEFQSSELFPRQHTTSDSRERGNRPKWLVLLPPAKTLAVGSDGAQNSFNCYTMVPMPLPSAWADNGDIKIPEIMWRGKGGIFCILLFFVCFQLADNGSSEVQQVSKDSNKCGAFYYFMYQNEIKSF